VLFKRNGKFYCRVWIPLHLRPYFGTKEIWRSLKTTNRAEAKLLSHALLETSDKLFLLLRADMLTEAQIVTVVAEYKKARLESFSEARRKVGTRAFLPPELKLTATPLDFEEQASLAITHHTDKMQHLHKQIQTNSFTDAHPLAMALLTSNNLEASVNSPEFNLLCEFIYKAQMEISHTIIDRLNGNYNNPHDNIRNKLSPSPAYMVPPVDIPPSKLLSELWGAYSKEKMAKKKWTEGTAKKNLDAYNLVTQILGDRSLKAYDDAEAVLLIETLEGGDRKPKTVNFHTELLSSMWKDAIKKPHAWGITYNPFEGKGVEDRRGAQELKDPYGVAEIEGMFKGLSKIRQRVEPERFWVPLICLYSAMRSNEACQLRIEDIEEIDGVKYFTIRHDPANNQTTKNKKTRICPIHPVLLKLGFMKYHKQQQDKKEDRLFSNLKLYRGKWNKDLGNWFNITFEPKYTDNPKHSLHSLKHTFITWFKHHGKLKHHEERLLKALDAHSGDGLDTAETDLTFDHYGKQYHPKQLAKLLKRLDYGADLNLIRPYE